MKSCYLKKEISTKVRVHSQLRVCFEDVKIGCNTI